MDGCSACIGAPQRLVNGPSSGVPTETEPFIIDFAPCATLPTHVRYAKRYGKTLPEGVVADAQGGRTTDPKEVCDGDGFQPHTGAINPLGNKGYGLLREARSAISARTRAGTPQRGRLRKSYQINSTLLGDVFSRLAQIVLRLHSHPHLAAGTECVFKGYCK